MNSITQYRPAYFSGFDNETALFNTLDQLTQIDFVKRFTGTHGDDVFHRFSLAPQPEGWLLMAEYNYGCKWWVVGRVKEPIDGLSQWVPAR